jgi:hypothetical protein
MPKTKYARRSQRAKLNHFQTMELWLGPRSDGSSFESDEERREAWFRNRDWVMKLWAKGGRRPQGWWYYEAPEKGLRRYPGYEHERSVLYEFSDVLSEAERSQLEAEWRKEFDRSWDPHFFHCAGPGKIFSGDHARELHWLWADIPPALVDAWTAERQRRGEVVCELQEESQDGEAVTETSSPPDNERHAG